jgi:hypothetical protein
MRATTREKRLAQSQHFLTGRGTARAYGVGAIGPDPRRTVFFILCGVAAVAFLSFVVYSVIVFPGVLLIWAVFVAVERSTSVVVTDEGMAILARSEFNGRPRRFVALLPPGMLTDPTVQRSGRYVHLPTYGLWLRKKEYEALTSAVMIQTAGQMALAPLGTPRPETFPSSRAGGAGAMIAVRTDPTQSGYPSPPRGNPEPGWQTIGARVNDQWYWDGQNWTKHRRWVGRQWVEDPSSS